MIITLQETRKFINNSKSYNYVNKLRDANKNGDLSRIGGGVAIGIRADITYTDITKLFEDLYGDIELICVRLIHPLFEACIMNLYLSQSNSQKKHLKGIEDKILLLMAIKPNVMWFIAGDFNL